MDSYNWTTHTTSSATRSRERHCFESDTASIATSLRERHNFERDTTSRATQLRERYNFERATPFFENVTTSGATQLRERQSFKSDQAVRATFLLSFIETAIFATAAQQLHAHRKRVHTDTICFTPCGQLQPSSAWRECNKRKVHVARLAQVAQHQHKVLASSLRRRRNA